MACTCNCACFIWRRSDCVIQWRVIYRKCNHLDNKKGQQFQYRLDRLGYEVSNRMPVNITHIVEIDIELVQFLSWGGVGVGWGGVGWGWSQGAMVPKRQLGIKVC